MADGMIKPTRHPKNLSYYLAILIHLPALFLNYNKTRSNLQSSRIVNPRSTCSGRKATRKERKKRKRKSLYLRNRQEISTLQNHQGSKPSILLFFSFFWRCTPRTPFDSRRTVYIRFITQIQGDERFGTYTTHAVTTGLIIPSARVTGSVCRGVATHSALSNGFGAAQTSRHVSIFVLLVLRLAMILVERYIYVRGLSTIAQNLLLANARNSFAEAGALAGREVTI